MLEVVPATEYNNYSNIRFICIQGLFRLLMIQKFPFIIYRDLSRTWAVCGYILKPVLKCVKYLT